MNMTMWTDWVQVAVVTAAAAVALVAIARPYFTRRATGAPPCANCPSASARRTSRPAASVHTLRLVKTQDR